MVSRKTTRIVCSVLCLMLAATGILHGLSRPVRASNPPPLQLLHQPHRDERREPDGEIDVEGREQREQVQALVRAVQVGQVEREHLDLRQEVAQRGHPGVVRPVAASDRERALVEPEQVPALGARRLLERAEHPHAGVLEVTGDGLRLAPSGGLPRPEQDDAPIGRQHRVVDVDRVGVTIDRCLADHDLGPGPLELGPAGAVLLGGAPGVGLGVPTVLPPVREVGAARRPHVHPTDRPDLVLSGRHRAKGTGCRLR